MALDACLCVAAVILLLWSHARPVPGIAAVLLVFGVLLAQGHGPGWRDRT